MLVNYFSGCIKLVTLAAEIKIKVEPLLVLCLLIAYKRKEKSFTHNNSTMVQYCHRSIRVEVRAKVNDQK
jgi:hypothetical protein